MLTQTCRSCGHEWHSNNSAEPCPNCHALREEPSVKLDGHYAANEELVCLLTDVAQVMDGWQINSNESWTSYDNSVRKRISAMLEILHKKRDRQPERQKTLSRKELESLAAWCFGAAAGLLWLAKHESRVSSDPP